MCITFLTRNKVFHILGYLWQNIVCTYNKHTFKKSSNCINRPIVTTTPHACHILTMYHSSNRGTSINNLALHRELSGLLHLYGRLLRNATMNTLELWISSVVLVVNSCKVSPIYDALFLAG